VLKIVHHLDAVAESARETSDGARKLLLRGNRDFAKMNGAWTVSETAKAPILAQSALVLTMESRRCKVLLRPYWDAPTLVCLRKSYSTQVQTRFLWYETPETGWPKSVLAVFVTQSAISPQH
jgi:hypothetical protein